MAKNGNKMKEGRKSNERRKWWWRAWIEIVDGMNEKAKKKGWKK